MPGGGLATRPRGGMMDPAAESLMRLDGKIMLIAGGRRSRWIEFSCPHRPER
jgi:hypothetical protein